MQRIGHHEEDRVLLDAVKRILMGEWDPIGVKDAPDAADEYDAYAAEVCALLKRGASKQQIADYLETVVVARMGLVETGASARAAQALKSLLEG